LAFSLFGSFSSVKPLCGSQCGSNVGRAHSVGFMCGSFNSVKPLRGAGLIVCDPSLVFAVIDSLFGGEHGGVPER